MKKRQFFLMVTVVIIAITITASCGRQEKTDVGYLAAEPYRGDFMAIGQDRIDIISESGVTELLHEQSISLNDVAVDGDTAVAVGEDGKIAVVKDSEVTVFNESKAMYSVCRFGGEWLIGSKRGTLLRTEDFNNFTEEHLPSKGKIISIASNNELCMAATDKGEIITSDGGEWTALDYKEVYEKGIDLRGIEAFDSTFWAYGAYDDGSAAIIMSQEGEVWSNRELTVGDTFGVVTASDMCISGICSDGEQKIALLSDGRLLILPDCVACNKLEQIADFEVSAIACDGKKVLAAGEEFKYAEESVSAIRQDGIKSEAAYRMQQNGAFIIDVRTAEEYDEKHIKGSVRMDEDKIAEQLTDLCTDKTRDIIFYCATGVRSEKALNIAKNMGYINVYNLGGIDNWQYSFEP